MSTTPPGSPADVPTCYRHSDRETYISCQRCGRPICPDCMREAAVGFHCPVCVAEARRTTRAARTAYGGLRPANPGIVSWVLIGINAVVWLAIVVTGWTGSWLIQRLALSPVGVCGSKADPGGGVYPINSEQVCLTGTNPPGDGQWIPGVAHGAWWELLTSAFTHVELWHIGFNMLALWILGPQLEAALGRARFVALYLTSGLAGSVCVFWLADAHGLTLGASGAIFGLMGALLVMAHKAGAEMSGLLGWIGANAVLTFLVPHVSWQGHAGGFVGGLVVAGILAYAPRKRRTTVQALGVGAVVVALLAATAVRAAMLT